jgi:tyrosyl-DNA phosphodiesterase 1
MYVPHVWDQLDILQEERKSKLTESSRSTLQSSSSIPSGSRSSSERNNTTHSAHSHKAISIASKIEAAAPYFLFLVRAQSSERTHNEPLSITFHELLDNSLGQLHSSMLMNFMVEMDWLDAQYRRHNVQDKPLLIVYDDITHGSKPMPPNVTLQKVHTPSPFGHHHSKLSFYYYMDQSMRVVVHTSNFIESDWENRTQG